MPFFQVRSVAICLLINALDGFDILVIAFLAPEIAQQWRLSPDTLGILLSAGLAVCIGLGVNAAVIALYAVVADVYPVNIRTTAIGWAIGVGRFSAVLSPAIAGFVLDLGVEEGILFLIFPLPMLLVADLVLAIKPKAAE